MTRFFPFLVAGALAASACGCILSAEDGAAADEPKAGDTANATAEKPVAKDKRIAPNWQDELATRLKNDTTGQTDAWGLFSEGGWSDNGQVLIFAKTGTAKANAQLALVLAGTKKIGTERAVTAAEWKKFTPATEKAQGLESVEEQIFDSLIYDYVHVKKAADGTVTVEKTVRMKLAKEDQYPQHEALIKAFNQFKPQPKDKIKMKAKLRKPAN